MPEIRVPGLFRTSSALRHAVENWSDWSDEGLWNFAQLVKATVLMNVLETAWFNRAVRPWRNKGTDTDEFIAWVENWLAK
jgi:hypothetical protein